VNDARRFAPATERNREPIAAVLQDVLPAAGLVLEIASGTGEHATHFATRFPPLRFQPSDPDPEARESIEAWRRHAALPNLLPPIEVDVCDPAWSDPLPALDAVLCINMIHIAPWSATEGLLAGAATRLAADRLLYLYGPYRRDGRHTSASNADFDASLRGRNPEWGVRDLEAVQRRAQQHGFATHAIVPMPANNLSVVLRRS